MCVTLWHPLLAKLVPQCTIRGNRTVPVILRGAPQNVFSGRVTLRINFNLIPEKFTFVIHRLSVTLLLVLPLLVIDFCSVLVTTLTVPTRSVLASVYVLWATHFLTVRASVLIFAVVPSVGGTLLTTLVLTNVIRGTLRGLM